MSVAANDESEFVHSNREDEIGTLSRALRDMVASLREQEKVIKDANRDLEYFARIASHDLRGPVRRVGALASLLEHDVEGTFSAKGREALRRIRDESAGMTDQLDELRAFSRLSQSELVRQKLDLQSIVHELLDLRRDEIARRGLRVTVERMPPVDAYRSLVTLLYGNLIDNALLHAREDGFALSFTCESREGELVLGVENSGSTLPGNASELFEAYRSGSDGEERTGLGLSICRRIVGRHSGRIWVEQEQDRVHFLFTLAGATGDA